MKGLEGRGVRKNAILGRGISIAIVNEGQGARGAREPGDPKRRNPSKGADTPG